MKYLFAYLSLLLFVVGTSCKTGPGIISQPDKRIEKLISFRKSPCFGKCQVYRLSLYTDGMVILEGKENLDKTGVHFCQLNKETKEKFYKEINTLNWKSYKNSYFRNIPDLPSTELIYYGATDSIIKSITSNTLLPKEIETIQSELANLIKSEKWTQILKKEDLTNPNLILSEIQVDMDSSLTKDMLEEKFAAYGLKSKKRISEYMNFFLFNYDTKMIESYEMLILLRKVPGVRLAIYNRKLEGRDDF